MNHEAKAKSLKNKSFSGCNEYQIQNEYGYGEVDEVDECNNTKVEIFKNTNESIKDKMINAVQSAQAFLYKPNPNNKRSTI